MNSGNNMRVYCRERFGAVIKCRKPQRQDVILSMILVYDKLLTKQYHNKNKTKACTQNIFSEIKLPPQGIVIAT